MGFPPKPIEIDPEVLLRDAKFGNRERIIVEVNEEMLDEMMGETQKNEVQTEKPYSQTNGANKVIDR